LENCLGRVIEEWQPLVEYFKDRSEFEIMKKQETLPMLKMIHVLLKKVSGMNRHFQGE
jgi:hypothetical protein